jgi:hypothetical protein
MVMIVIFYSSVLWADYRVFQLAITDTNTGKSRMVHSTLDQYQYPTYHHVKLAEQISYITSWKCLGNNSHFRQLCKNPSEGPVFGPARAPATPSQGL